MDDRWDRRERCREIATSYDTLGPSEAILRRLRVNAAISERYGREVPGDPPRPSTAAVEEAMARCWEAKVPHHHVRN